MVPTDRQLVDCLLATIRSTSTLIEKILEEEIERCSQGEVVNMAHIKALDAVRKNFHLRALIMEYALNVPSETTET